MTNSIDKGGEGWGIYLGRESCMYFFVVGSFLYNCGDTQVKTIKI